MTAKIILSCEPSSARFTDRVLLLDSQETVKVSRSSTEEKPDTYNAVFDCRVLSKSQAAFSLGDGNFYLKDTGSSNGTFINNFRLSKAGKESEKTQIYSQDIIRFGSQVEIDKTAKCIIARIRIYFTDGTEFSERAVSDKFFRSKADTFGQEISKKVKFVHQELNIEDKVDNLEKMITQKFGKENEMLKETIVNLEKKLKRKQSENNNLLENITKITDDELHRVSEIYDLKEALECKNKESEKVADELAVKVKEQIENVKVKDLQSDLEETRQALQCTTEEIWLLKEKIRVDEETAKKKDKEISRLSISLSDIEEYKRQIPEQDDSMHIQMKIMLKDCRKEIENQKEEIKQLNDLMTKGDGILKEKEKEISWLTNLSKKDKEEIKIKDKQYVNLKSLMSEESESVERIEMEMKRLLNLIAEDQEIILEKNQTIIELQNYEQEKDEYVAENLNLNEKINTIKSENMAKVEKLDIDIEHLKKIIVEKDEKIKEMKVSLEKQEEIFTTYESLKAKIKESMFIIEQKSKEIENIQNGVKNPTDNYIQIEELNREISELKASVCQKESDIASLKELIERKEDVIIENNAKIEINSEENTQLKAVHADKTKELDNIITEKQEIINNLKEKIENDQTKIYNAKSESDNLKKEKEKHLESKDDEIEILKGEIIKEKDIVAHVQYTQEREIMEKEREISILNTILTQERKTILEKEDEVKKLRNFPIEEKNIVTIESPPARPPRTKSLVITADIQEQANISTIPDEENDNSDTITFHDALNNDLSVLSDEEDVLIEDLELDEETDDRQHRRSDININNEFSLG